MNRLIITKLKGQASFQDLGRNHAQHLGFSGSGAADEYSYKLANGLLGNDLNATALEVTMGQFSVRAEAPCRLILTGADCQAKVFTNNGSDEESEKTVFVNQAFTLDKNETLSLQTPLTQLHSYVAIRGGFTCQQWLGSSSQAVNEYSLAFGEGVLSVNSALHFPTQKLDDLNSLLVAPVNHFHQKGPLTLRFIPSPLWLSLTGEKQQEILKQLFSISPHSNRMGYRLSGRAVNLTDKHNSLSKPVCFGTIQLPNDGQPIILMKDRQTIGGYPTLGTVIQTDLFRLSQKRAGELIALIPTTLEQAQAQLLAFQQKFNS